MLRAPAFDDDPRIASLMRGLVAGRGVPSAGIGAIEEDAPGAAFRRQPSIIPSDGERADGAQPVACLRVRPNSGDVPAVSINQALAPCATYPFAPVAFSKPAASALVTSALHSMLAQ